ncbi:MAG: hypothetical protein RBR67_21020 [Desulfobacterium sp.]|jgi:hypothetical protein|nr:hypothetical protein [Desulfobacterium sp.]MDY0376268.1 hypothetical protein [Desulfobacterium sp.]
MKYFPLKTALFCILFTPLLYTVILGGLESFVGPVYQQKIENRLIGDYAPLLHGTIQIQDLVGQNIHKVMNDDLLVSFFGLDLDIVVTAKGEVVLFPLFLFPGTADTNLIEPLDPVQTARQNYELMDRGLTVKVTARIDHGTVGANLILGVLIAISLLLFCIYYRRGSAKYQSEDQEKGRQIERLKADEMAYKNALQDLQQDRHNLFESIKFLRASREEVEEKATITEDDLFEEIVSLEKKIEENIKLQQEKELEIAQLKDEVQKKERRKGTHSRRHSFELSQKRFTVLYKNLDFTRRALTGILELSDEMQIKAEELVHLLNEDMSKVIVKRKVFAGKKNKNPSFEVLFGYNGRLYFRTNKRNRCEILLVGTKNSQAKDMDFLHNL